MGERKKRIGGTGMKWYAIGKTLTPLDRAPESGAAVVLLAVLVLMALMHRQLVRKTAHA